MTEPIYLAFFIFPMGLIAQGISSGFAALRRLLEGVAVSLGQDPSLDTGALQRMNHRADTANASLPTTRPQTLNHTA